MGDVADIRHHPDNPAAAPRVRFNYKGKHRYVITLPFAKPIPQEAAATGVRTLLDTLRDSCWSAGFEVLAYCVLPDRFLMVARGEREDADMRAFLRTFRAAASAVLAPAAGRSLWQRKYLERVLRKHELTSTIASGIFREAVKARLAKRVEDYPYLGSFAFPRERSGRVKFWDQEGAGHKERGGEGRGRGAARR